MSIVRWLCAVVVAGPLSACMTRSIRVEPGEASGTGARQKIAELLLRQPDFGSVSIIPVRFENSRIAGPIEEKGRTYYCVATEMRGRRFGKPERPKALVRQETRPEGTTFAASAYDPDICSGHRREPYPEFEEAANRRRGA
jgi:hypothetical protein